MHHRHEQRAGGDPGRGHNGPPAQHRAHGARRRPLRQGDGLGGVALVVRRLVRLC